jgi:hypothetical protein
MNAVWPVLDAIAAWAYEWLSNDRPASPDQSPGHVLIAPSWGAG